LAIECVNFSSLYAHISPSNFGFFILTVFVKTLVQQIESYEMLIRLGT